MVRFSFIVPIFNTDTFYLKQCLETIANQTFTDYDCLLINDCSTNAATISFLTQWVNDHPDKFRLIHNDTNLGLGESRNIGIENVTGEYVLFVDADDYISTDMLQVVNTYLCHNPYNIDILSFSAAWFINGEVYEFTQGYKEWQPYLITNVNINHNVIRDKSTSWTKCWRRKFLMDHHIRYTKDKGYGEDLYFHVVAFSKAQKIYVIHERLYVYRRDTPGSLSVNNDWRSRIISTLNYAYKAYDAIRMDNSNVSKHYQIFFKFFFETNMGGLLPDVQKQPWFSEVYEQFNSFYEDINRQTEAALLKHP